MQNLRFVSIRKLEVVEMAPLIRSFNRGVSIRIWLSGIGLKCRTKPSRLRARNRRIFAIRKMEAPENTAVIWISNSRFAIRNGARWWRVEE
jgi:hypothetical protein